jgi:hypothetical protein
MFKTRLQQERRGDGAGINVGRASGLSRKAGRLEARPTLTGRAGLARLLLVAFVPWGGVALHAADSPSVVTAAKPPFRFADVNERSLGLWDGDRPVLVYNHGAQSKAGVPADRARSTYIHPLYGLDGEVLTDDFPRDHYHHRGLFWAWPHVTIEGRHYDLWMLKGIEQRFERWLAKQAGPEDARLGVENGWFVGDRKVMREEVWLRVSRETSDARALDLDFTWTPLDQPVTLAGAEGKSYGGLTLRFAPGTNTVITIPAGRTTDDLYMTNLPWVDLTRQWSREKNTSGVAIFVHPSHREFPPQWLTRHYGVLCLGWPGVSAKTFPPGQPIECRYRVWIHRGAREAAVIQRAYGSFTALERISSRPTD